MKTAQSNTAGFICRIAAPVLSFAFYTFSADTEAAGFSPGISAAPIFAGLLFMLTGLIWESAFQSKNSTKPADIT